MTVESQLPGHSETIDLQQQVARLQALLEASRQVHANLREEEVLEQVLRIVVRELEMAAAAFPGTGLTYGEAISADTMGGSGNSLRSYPLNNRNGQRMIELVEEAYAAAVKAAATGALARAPAEKADAVFSAAERRMPHALGHGIGLDTHEAPLLRSQGEGTDIVLLPGMVFTIEPGLYHPEHGGVRWENDVLLTESGGRVLTTARIIRIK